MSYNFGTYTAHAQLPQAMENLVRNVQNKHEFNERIKIQKDRLAMDKEKLDIQVRNADINSANDLLILADNTKRAKKDKKIDAMMTALYGDVSNQDLIVTSPTGEISLSNDAHLLVDSWSTKSDYGDLINMAKTIDPTVNLNLDDIKKISANTEDYTKHKLVNLHKSFSGKSADQINSFMDSNPEFKNSLSKYYISIGAPLTEDESIGDRLFSKGVETSDSPLINSFANVGSYTTAVGDQSGWGGPIKSKSWTTTPTRKEKKQYNMLVKAVTEMKNRGSQLIGDLGDEPDTIFIDHTPDGFRITENDADLGLGFADDTSEVKFINGVPHINLKNLDMLQFKDKWIPLNESANYWE